MRNCLEALILVDVLVAGIIFDVVAAKANLELRSISRENV